MKSKVKVNPKVQANTSIIEGSGKGLFAIVDIKKGSVIVEFKGKVRAQNEKVKSSRSNIFFNDNSILECPENDLASYANDCINFTRERRDLMPALNSDEPFYKKHKGTTVNASIKINDNLHRAFLMAGTDIARGTEIFCHYGFQYWFMQEITTIGFSEEVEGELKNFPKRLFDYPAFTAYIHEFYDGVMKIETKQYDKITTDVILHMEDGGFYCFPMKDLSSRMTAIPMDELDE